MDRNDKSVTGIAMVAHALVHTYELSIPILMVIWLVEFSLTEAVLGGIVAIGYAIFGLGALPSGILSDRFGSQRLIILCLLGMGISFLLLSFATNIVILAAAIVIWGIAASIYHPAGLSLISTAVKERGTGFALHGMAGNIGIALGPFIAVVFIWLADWRTATLLLAIPAFVAVIAIHRIDIDEMSAADIATDGSGQSNPDIDSVKAFVSSSRSLFIGGFSLVFLVIVFNGLYYRGILTFLPELLADFVALGSTGLEDTADFGWSDLIYVGLLVVGIGGQYAGGMATDRVPIERSLVAGYILLVVIALLFVPAASMGLISLLVISFVLGFVLFFLQPIDQVAVSEYSPAQARGLSYGYTYVAQFGVGALGAAIVGVILTYSTQSVVFLVLSGFALISVVFSVLLLRRYGPGY